MLEGHLETLNTTWHALRLHDAASFFLTNFYAYHCQPHLGWNVCRAEGRGREGWSHLCQPHLGFVHSSFLSRSLLLNISSLSKILYSFIDHNTASLSFLVYLPLSTITISYSFASSFRYTFGQPVKGNLSFTVHNQQSRKCRQAVTQNTTVSTSQPSHFHRTHHKGLQTDYCQNTSLGLGENKHTLHLCLQKSSKPTNLYITLPIHSSLAVGEIIETNALSPWAQKS